MELLICCNLMIGFGARRMGRVDPLFMLRYGRIPVMLAWLRN